MCFSSKHNNYTNINFLQALKNTESEIVIIGGSDYNDIQMNIDNYKYYNKAITAHMIPNTKKLPHLENPSEVLNCLTI